MGVLQLSRYLDLRKEQEANDTNPHSSSKDLFLIGSYCPVNLFGRNSGQSCSGGCSAPYRGKIEGEFCSSSMDSNSCKFRTLKHWLGANIHQQEASEVLPHVYTSWSNIGGGNILSQYGSKYMLPIGTTRHDYEVGSWECISRSTSHVFFRIMKKLSYLQLKRSRRGNLNVLYPSLSSMS